MTEKLIEVESIDAEVLKEIIEATSPGPVLSPGTADVQPRRAPADEVDRIVDLVREKMSSVMELGIPLSVDVGTGKNWAETGGWSVRQTFGAQT